MHGNHDIDVPRAIARTIANAYACEPNVCAVLLSGSVARGWSDRWSDIEIVVCRDDVPSSPTAAALMQAIGATSVRVFGREPETGAWEEEFAVQAYKIDLAQIAANDVTALLHSVTVNADTSLQKHAIVAGIRDSLPLYGPESAREWQQQTRVYPSKLRHAMIPDQLHLRASLVAPDAGPSP